MHTFRSPRFVSWMIAAPAAIAMALASASAAPTPVLRLVALAGQAAPGTPPGTRFEMFGPAEFDGAPSLSADSVMSFAARLTDETAGFWLDRGSGPELLARSGDQAPGAEPGVVFSQRVAEIFIFTPPLSVPGHLVLHNTLSGPGVGFANDEGLWTSTGSGLVLLMREGAAAPGLAGVQLSTPILQSADNAGRAIISSVLTGAVVDGNNESIWRIAPGAAPELLAREGSAAPGAGVGVIFAAPAVPSAFPIIMGNAAGDLLFQGNLAGPGTGSSNDEALFIRNGAGTRLFIRESDPVPGMSGFVFREGFTAGFQSSNISFGDDGRVALAARVANSTATASALVSDTSGTLTTLVRSGDPAPGTTGLFDILVNPVLNSHGDLAFLASTTPISPTPVLGLWVRSAGGLRAIAVPGQAVPGATVQSIQIIDGFNSAGFLLFTAILNTPGGGSATALLLADPAGEIAVVARTGQTLAGHTVGQLVVRRGALSDDAHIAFGVKSTDFSSAQFIASVAGACYANCDNSTAAPALNVLDFSCFLNRFAAGDSYANCDQSTNPPVLNVLDFGCYLNRFAAGCP